MIIYEVLENSDLQETVLGDDNSPRFQYTVKARRWFAAEVKDKRGFALLGCTVSPGFEFSDFEIGDKNQLISLYPRQEKLIKKLSS